jgi:prephenate dehydrogenase
VVEAAQRTLKERVRSFVPAHPIAGKEVAGIAHADATLYKDCQVILTPLAETDAALIARAHVAWTGVGAQVRTMTPEAHDAAFAAVSHLPHLLAFAAFLSIAQQPEGERFLELAGPGFRDFTRIAASDAKVWRDILFANREQVLAQAEHFKTKLFRFETALREGSADVVEDMIKEAARGRAGWQMNSSRN